MWKNLSQKGWTQEYNQESEANNLELTRSSFRMARAEQIQEHQTSKTKSTKRKLESTAESVELAFSAALAAQFACCQQLGCTHFGA